MLDWSRDMKVQRSILAACLWTGGLALRRPAASAGRHPAGVLRECARLDDAAAGNLRRSHRRGGNLARRRTGATVGVHVSADQGGGGFRASQRALSGLLWQHPGPLRLDLAGAGTGVRVPAGPGAGIQGRRWEPRSPLSARTDLFCSSRERMMECGTQRGWRTLSSPA